MTGITTTVSGNISSVSGQVDAISASLTSVSGNILSVSGSVDAPTSSSTSLTGGSIPDPKLVAHYKFDNDYNDSSTSGRNLTVSYSDGNLTRYYPLNQTSGNSAIDVAGTIDLNVTAIGAGYSVGDQRWVQGKIGNCLELRHNGASDGLYLVPNNPTQFTANFFGVSAIFSMACWVYLKLDDSGTRRIHAILKSRWGASTSGMFFAILSANTVRLQLHDGTTLATYDWTGLTLNLNTWYHIALTLRAGTNNTFLVINGVYIGGKTVLTNYNTTPVGEIGICGKDGDLFSGYIDDLRFYNGSMTLKTFKDIYNLGAGCENTTYSYPGFGTGKIKNASIFDGLGKSAVVSPFNFGSSNQTTFAWWQKIDEVTALNYYTVFSDYNQSQQGFFWIVNYSGGIGLNYSDGVQLYGVWSFFSTTLTTDWIHFVLTVDWVASTATLYKNGAFVATNALTTSVKPVETGKNLHIGAYASTHWAKFRGKLEDCRIYEKILSPTEISFLYNSGSGTDYRSNNFLVYPKKVEVDLNE
jgi:hypothetical protein